MPVVETRRNHNTNPRMVSSIAGWSVTSSGVTQTATAAGTQIDFPNNISAGNLFFYQTGSPTAAPGEVWSGSIEVTVPVGFPSVTLRLDSRGYTGGSSNSIGSSPNTLINPGETVRLTATSLPLIAGAIGVRNWLNSAATIVPGSRILVRSAVLVKAADGSEYFDGSTPPRSALDGAGWDYFAWDGTPNASTSTMTRELRLSTFPDMNPVPRVLVDAPTSLFPVGSVTVSLRRVAEGRTFDVRGGQRLPAGSPAIVLDAEAPFGVVSTYTVYGYDALGNLIGSFPVGTVTLMFTGTVVQQPLDARLSVRLDRQDGTGFELARTTPGSTVYAQGQVLPGLVGLGPRRGLQNVTLNLVVESAVDADKLQATLGTYETRQIPVWLVRTPPDQRIPRVFFCHVPQLVETDTYRHTNSGLVQYQATVEEVRPPATGISAAVLTHSDMKVFFTTHTGVKARYATHADIKRDTSLVGAANA